MPESIYHLGIFAGLEKEIIDEILNSCELRNYNEKEILMMEAEASNAEGYIIKHGRVSISIGGQKVAELAAWDMVGEIALLNEEARTATVTALADTEVIILTIDHLITMINNDSNTINKEIMRRIEENLDR